MANQKTKKNKMPKEQKTPFKELNFSEKVSYIFGYYKYYALAFLIAAAFIGYTVYSFIQNNYDVVCNIVAVDGKITGYDTFSDDITKGFSNYLGIDGKKTRVEIDFNYSLIVQPLDQEANVSQNKIYILASVGSIDGYTANRDYIDYFSTDTETFLVDLRELLTSDELERIGDENIIYYTKKDGTAVPIAVDLSGTKIKTETDLTMESPCYGVVVSAQNTENAVSFIRYAFDL